MGTIIWSTDLRAFGGAKGSPLTPLPGDVEALKVLVLATARLFICSSGLMLWPVTEDVASWLWDLIHQIHIS